MKCNQSRPGFELVSPCSFPTAITITPQAVIWHQIFLLNANHHFGPIYRTLITFQFRVELGVIVIKRDTTFHRYPELKPHNQMRFHVITSTPLYFGMGNHTLFAGDELLYFKRDSYLSKQSQQGKLFFSTVLTQVTWWTILFVCVYLPTPPHRQDDTRSIFKQRLIGLNSESSFSKTGCLIKAKEQSALLFTQVWRENNWIHTFPKRISTTWYAICREDLNLYYHTHFLRL